MRKRNCPLSVLLRSTSVLLILVGVSFVDILMNTPLGATQQVSSQEHGLSAGHAVPQGELEAVGRIPGCTATLISPNVVISAAHCVCTGSSSDDCVTRVKFTLKNVHPADDPTTPNDESAGRKDVTIPGDVFVHPEYGVEGWSRKDLALILLDQPVYEIAEGVVPISVAGPSQAVTIGDMLTIVGFGDTGAGCSEGSLGKRQTTIAVSGVVPDAIRFNHPGDHTCPGDSGGPALNEHGELVGVCSWGNFVDESTYRPTYENYNWIASIVSAAGRLEGFIASAGSTSDLESFREPYGYVPASGGAMLKIVGMGIAGSNDRVYAWHEDGTVSSGASSDLDFCRPRYSFSLPPGKTPTDIVGMGIAGSDDRVYTWYRDRTVSIGSSSDLDFHRAPYVYSLPPGKTPADIVGMGIAGSDDHVYAWYSDGTVSSGTSSDLGLYRSLYSYQLPYGKTPADISGMGIAGSNDHVYVWYHPSIE